MSAFIKASDGHPSMTHFLDLVVESRVISTDVQHDRSGVRAERPRVDLGLLVEVPVEAPDIGVSLDHLVRLSNAHDLWIGLGLDAKRRTFPSDRLLVIE
jgi:hypothetical protein